MNIKSIFTMPVLIAVLCIQTLSAQETRSWFQDGPFRFPKPNPKAKALPLIKVEGNKFVNSEGKTLLFRGQLGSLPWSEWKQINENMINLIMACDLSPLHDDPINAEVMGLHSDRWRYIL